ncbi:hypothetical protein QH639_20840 [Lysinibacillus sp. 1 U-2021]|uniref:hypothetical protein n=1 Tax=Lysinibacillus sp. 1 U-2021 TaxID=3039426 RepID=UPI002480D36F|nr:hypothetical protein [Lysinibacillus sp. 1 U-2021]WGT38235.1 hypothetical protein QH639_20840 [Lysinibacillus sp. 1 U-2021]
MKFTPLLNLKLPESTDFVNIEDINENMITIDNNLGTAGKDIKNHMDDAMPHKFTNNGKNYKYGFKANTAFDGLVFVYQEV